MQKRFSLVLFTVALGLIASMASAILHAAEDARSSVANGPEGSQKLAAELKEAFPNMPIQTVYETPVPGLLALNCQGVKTCMGLQMVSSSFPVICIGLAVK